MTLRGEVCYSSSMSTHPTCTRCKGEFVPTFNKNDKPHVMCTPCRAAAAAAMKAHRDKYGDAYRSKQRNYMRNRRQQVYDHYGNNCECCGETQYEFLSIDHKNGGGTQHRLRDNIRGSSIIGWIIANDYPDEFRILCHNCNQAIGFYGRCPHAS